MVTTFTYPSNSELMAIERDKIPLLSANRPIFEIIPMKNIKAELLMTEQLANIVGIQGVRGMNGAPKSVNGLGSTIRYGEPGVYGEFMTIDEKQLTAQRQFESYNQPIKIDDLVLMKQEQLLERRLNRIELNGWTLLANGTFTATDPVSGAVLHTDTYATQTYVPGIPWETSATATPLADFRGVQLLALGHSVSFGSNSRAYMNRLTLNKMLSNTNAADLYGRRVTGLATANSLNQINELFLNDDLPQIVVYEGSYFTEAGVATRYIPNNKVIVVGHRTTGVPVGNYQFTRNANNPDMAPGPYMRVTDSLNTGNPVPRTIRLDDGHNGGPVLYYPAAVVAMTIGVT